MPISNLSVLYFRSEFAALVGTLAENLGRIQTAIGELELVVPDMVVDIVGDAVRITWNEYPPETDIDAIDALMPTITGGATTDAPVELNSFAVAATTSNSDQTKIDHTTDALKAGTYQVLWTSSIRMQAVAASTGVQGKVRLERSDGVAVEQTDAWDLNVNHAYNGGITFVVQEGQTIRARLMFSRLGASGTAEMSGARITIDKIS